MIKRIKTSKNLTQTTERTLRMIKQFHLITEFLYFLSLRSDFLQFPRFITLTFTT